MGRKNLDKIFPMNFSTCMGITLENTAMPKSRLASFMDAGKNMFIMGAPSGCETAFMKELAKYKPKTLRVIAYDLELDKIGGLTNVIKLWNKQSTKDVIIYATRDIAENIDVILTWNRTLEGFKIVDLKVNHGHSTENSNVYLTPLKTESGLKNYSDASNPYRIVMGDVSIAWLDRNELLSGTVSQGFAKGLYDYIYTESHGESKVEGVPSTNMLSKSIPSEKRGYVYVHGITGSVKEMEYIRNLGFSIVDVK